MSRLLYLLNWHIEKKPAYNGRFGAMAAVARRQFCAKLHVIYPAASSVEAATAPSRWDVTRKRGGSTFLNGQQQNKIDRDVQL